MGDIGDGDADLSLLLFSGEDVGRSIVNGEIGLEFLDDFDLADSDEIDVDCFFVSKLFNRFNGFECSYDLVIVIDCVFLLTKLDNTGCSIGFFPEIIGGVIGRLLILYIDRSIRSNGSEHRYFLSNAGLTTDVFVGLSGRGILIFNGGTRNADSDADVVTAFPVSERIQWIHWKKYLFEENRSTDGLSG